MERLDAGLDTTGRVESVCDVPLCAGKLRLLLHGVPVEVLFHCCGVVDWVENILYVISMIRELFSDNEGEQF